MNANLMKKKQAFLSLGEIAALFFQKTSDRQTKYNYKISAIYMWVVKKAPRWNVGAGMTALHIGLQNDQIDASSAGPFAPPFAHTAHSFACFALLASLERSARALHCAHMFAYLLQSSWERVNCLHSLIASISYGFNPLWGGRTALRNPKK